MNISTYRCVQGHCVDRRECKEEEDDDNGEEEEEEEVEEEKEEEVDNR